MSDERTRHLAALLPTGMLLVAGGENAGGFLDSAELYDPVLDLFVPVLDLLSEPRAWLGAPCFLTDGSVLLAGGVAISTEQVMSAWDTRIAAEVDEEMYGTEGSTAP